MGGEDGEIEKTEGISLISPETQSANRLLERKGDDSYITEWTELLQEERVLTQQTDEASIVVFRLGKEWLGMSTIVFNEVAERRPVHKIPHRSNSILTGLTNFRGQLRLCINMHHLLEIVPTEPFPTMESSVVYRRMVAIQQGDDFWIFPVDEVLGIFRFSLETMNNVPVTVSKSTANYIKGVVSLNDINIGLLDEGLLLYSLKRSLL